MPSGQRKQRRKKRIAPKAHSLDFVVDRLEQRMLLAADVRVTGSNVKITGDNLADDVAVYFNDATSSVWVNDGESLHDTLLESIGKLTIATKNSGAGTDIVSIGSRVEVTSRTSIRLGSGTNTLSFGGLHKSVSVSGGSGIDDVTFDGGLGTSKNVFNLKSGNDSLTIATDVYTATATGDTPLADYLATLPTDISVLDGLGSIRSNLGGGHDIFQVLYEGEAVTESQMLGTLESLGLGSYTSLSEAVTELESAAEAAGIRRLRVANINGAAGTDTMLPGSFSAVIDFLGTQKGFETFSDPPAVTATLANDTAAFGQTNDDGLTYDATIEGTVVGGVALTVAIDGGSATSVSLGANGAFVFDPGLATDGSDDGAHIAQLIATSNDGVTSTRELTFTLDSTGPAAATIDLAAASDDGTVGDGRTSLQLVSLSGTGDATSVGLLVDQGLPINVNADGTFSIDGVTLDLGSNTVAADFYDAAGNATRSELVVVRDAPTGSIELAEDGSFVVEHDLAIDLGQTEGSRTLRFKLDAAFDSSDDAAIQDIFSIYLLDTTDPSQTLLDRGDNGTSIFSLVDDQADFVPGLVRYDGEFIEIDLTSLGDMSAATLRLQLINHDADNGTQVAISQLTNVVDLEGVASPVFDGTSTPSMPGGSIVNYESLTEATDVDVLLSNVRFDSSTGNYTAELQLRTTADNHGRQAAVAFDNLPAGVVLLNASGLNMAGDPYLNLTELTPSGGFRKHRPTQKVLVEFSNPAGVPFVMQPQVYTGLPNQAPTIGAIGPLTLMPGDVFELPIPVTDADGDTVTLSIDAAGGMPTTTLRADQTLVFAPKPDELGSYSFTLIASDGARQSTQTVQLTVEADPITTTRISGSILNTNEQPLAGVVIELGSFQATTDANGEFVLDLGSTTPAMDDALLVRGELLTGSETYPFIAEKLHLLMDQVFDGNNNVLARPIYLPALDTANGVTIDPAVDNTVSVSLAAGEANAEVFVAAGSLMDQAGNPFTGQLSITEVPAALTPAALPVGFLPDTVVTIQPGEMQFTQPAALTLPNRAGLPPGTELDLWSINPVTGTFDVVGKGRVTADGSQIETIEGGIRNSSWHLFVLDVINIDLNYEDTGNLSDECDPCLDLLPGTSMVESHSGAVVENHNLVTYQSQGETRGVQLVYNSQRADSKPIVHKSFSLSLDSFTFGGSLADVRIISQLTFSRDGLSLQVPGSDAGGSLADGTHYFRASIGGRNNIAIQGDLSSMETGVYEYSMNTGFVFLANGDISQSSGVQGTTTGRIVHVNSADSAFGSGWELAGLQYLVEGSDGSVLMVDGNGSEQLFELAADGVTYDSPPGHFSTLTKLADGTFQHTTTDQTVSSFDTDNRLTTVVDRNGNTTTYAYDQGRLVSITDPVGLVTAFNYVDGKVTSIVDPAGRVTQFEYDSAGNLTRVIDPDETTRTWEYDDAHHIVAEIDQRGFREQMEYDFAGRAKRAIRKDGSVLQYSPLQVKGLAPAELTSNPNTAPFAGGAIEPTTTFVNGNGEVRYIGLTNAGQQADSTDGVGQQTTYTYNDELLVTSSTDARGFRTDYVYDAFGNLITVQDSISAGGGSGGVDFGSPAVLTENSFGYSFSGHDLNGDGHLDYIADGAVMLNDGAGGLNTVHYLDGDGNTYRTADMNGDGLLDIVASDNNFGDEGPNPQELNIWIANVDGTYADAVRYSVPVLDYEDPDDVVLQRIGLSGLAVADFNNDSHVDVILARPQDGIGQPFESYVLYLNDGSGGLNTPTIISPNAGFIGFAWNLEAADLNGDGNQDLVISNSRPAFPNGYQLTVMLGDGIGGFSAPTSYALGFDTNTFTIVQGVVMELADFNADGDLDAVVAITHEGKAALLFGDGAGGFGPSTIVAETSDISLDNDTQRLWTAITSADLNGDGALDLALTSKSGGFIGVLLNNGDGTFAERQEYNFNNFDSSFFAISVHGLFATDFNGDGTLDLVTPGGLGNDIAYLSGNGDGTFESWDELELAFANPGAGFGDEFAPEQVETIDLNNDGILDIVTRHAETGAEIRYGLGNRQFADAVELDIAGDFITRSMDFLDANGDNLTDIIVNVGSSLTPNHQLFVNQGNGAFAAPIGLELGSDGFTVGTIVGDFNNDGVDDLAVLEGDLNDGELFVLLGDGNSNFTGSSFTLTERPREFTVGDVNGDGKLDVVVTYRNVGQFTVHLGDGNGNLGAGTVYSNGITSPLLEDVNADGFVDLLAMDFDSSRSIVDGAVMLNDGNGMFGPVIFVGTEGGEFIDAADVNGDSIIDIVVTSATHFHIAPGLAGGGFGAASSYRGGGYSPSIVNLDNDGVADIVGVRSQRNRISAPEHHRNAITIHYGFEEAAATPLQFTYDATFNQLTSITDELGRQTFFEIDATNGNTLSMTEVIGLLDTTSAESDDLVTLFAYTSTGLVEQITDPLGRVTQVEYDGLGRNTRTTLALGTDDEGSIIFGYDAAGNMIEMIDATQNRTTFNYDVLNRTTSVTDATTGQLTRTYDESGNLVEVQFRGEETVTYAYDALDRVVVAVDAFLFATQYQYDNESNGTAIVDALGKAATLEFDSRGRVVEQTDRNGKATSFFYDQTDNLTGVLDASGNLTRYSYDARRRLTQVLDPTGKDVTYEYDLVNNVVSRGDRNGGRIDFSFDDVNRKTAEEWWSADGDVENTVAYQYDKSGNLVSATDLQSSLAITYDARDRFTSVRQNHSSNFDLLLSYEYDTYGNVTTVADSLNGVENATTTYEYDTLNRVARIIQQSQSGAATAKRVDFGYGSSGQLTHIQRFGSTDGTGASVESSFEYDNRFGLTSIVHANSATQLAHYEYHYDATQRLETTIEGAEQTNYVYDEVGRLRNVNGTLAGLNESYSYDATGNRTIANGDTVITEQANRISRDATYTYDYDGEGNLVRKTNTATATFSEFHYDNRNRLARFVSYDAEGLVQYTTEYTYDLFDRRISKSHHDNLGSSTIHFGYDREDIILDLDQETAIQTRYLHGPGLDQVLAQEQENETQWLLTDHLGSTRLIVDTQGGVQNEIQYDAFGSVLNESSPTESSRFLFAGRELDSESGLYYNRHRYLDPSTGRFMSEDPLGFAGSPFNLYAYANNAPTNFVDPMGNEPTSGWLSLPNSKSPSVFELSQMTQAQIQELNVDLKSRGIEIATIGMKVQACGGTGTLVGPDDTDKLEGRPKIDGHPIAIIGDNASTPGDSHGCPSCPHPTAGPIISSEIPNVLLNGMPVATVGSAGSQSGCCGPNTFTIVGR